jgi:murein DD-endopeptidase MepM/ murein hydrolase activator NlpD
MVVPRSGQTLTFNVTVRLLQTLALILIVSSVAFLALGVRHNLTLGELKTLNDLRLVVEEQRTKIEQMQAEAEMLRQNFSRIKAMEEEIRDLLERESEVVRKGLSRASGSDLTTLFSMPVRPETLTSRQAPRGLRWPVEEGSQLILESMSLARAQEEIRATADSLTRAMALLKDDLQDRIADLRAMPSYMPVNGKVTSPFGWRRSPFGGWRERHEGVDIAAPYGTPVLAAGDGKVTFAGWKAGWGRVVSIDHGNGYVSSYAHLSRIGVKLDATVARGTMIGSVGSTGRSTGTHLHLEVRKNGQLVDPLSLLK